ncbi:MAG: methyltransferase domain-containing protein [Bradymonadaceae bacterium]|nr:methyltransferase domain-containing protein [Lujinxingiaceae bacterium]
MISTEVLDVLQCPGCQGALFIGAARRPELVCEACETQYPIVDGIPDLVARQPTPMPGNYRTETLSNAIAGIFDYVAPVLSMAIWRCSPLLYVDLENRALGRANGGVFLEAPIGTGVTLSPVVAPYHDVQILGIDKSWKMLHQAAKRFKDVNARVQLIRADYERLPLKTGSVQSLQSINGLHVFTDRVITLKEFNRCIEPGGHISGSALVRSQEDVADVFLERYERYGIYPMLRSPQFLVQEMATVPFNDVRFSTHGAVMFFTSQTAS